jgi:hypothetical protein
MAADAALKLDEKHGGGGGPIGGRRQHPFKGGAVGRARREGSGASGDAWGGAGARERGPRHGGDSAAARRHCRATAAGCTRRGRARLTSGVERPWGPMAATGCGGERERAGWRGADKWGRQHSAPDSVFKMNQFYFKQIQICPKL